MRKFLMRTLPNFCSGPIYRSLFIITITLAASPSLAQQRPDSCPPLEGYELYEGPQFIGWKCDGGYTQCTSASPSGDCEDVCKDERESVVSGIPAWGRTIGIIYPDGTNSRWDSSRGLEITISHDHDGYAYLYDRKANQGLPQIVTPNGEVIRVTKEGVVLVFTPEQSSSSTTVTSAQTTTSSTITETLPPQPTLLLNGKEELEHQFFVKDSGSFTLEVLNTSQVSSSIEDIQDPCKIVQAKPVASLTLEISIESTKQFLQGIKSEQFEIPGGQSKSWTIKPTELIPFIDQYDQDILFGAKIKIKAWATDSPGTLLIDSYLNAYRLLDATDDKHEDSVLAIARTLGDGKGGVFRKRILNLEIPESAEVEIYPNTDEFSFVQETNSSYFKFDPIESDERISSYSQFQLRSLADGKEVGTIAIRGKVEPPNKIKLNLHQLAKTLQRIAVLSTDPRRAGKTPPDHLVHPAYLPPEEMSVIDSSQKAEQLAQDLQLRMEIRYGDLLKGIKWVEKSDPKNTINILWDLRSNREKKSPWAYGRAFDDLKDPNKIDNWTKIVAVIEGQKTWNKGEFAYRLSEAVNPGFVKNVTLYPDSMLENHKGFGSNKAILTREQILNAFAKTTIHEIAHSMSLKHPVQVGIRIPEEFEYQLLTVSPGSSSQTFRLSFHGLETEDISFEETGLKLSIWQALQKLRTIGYANHSKKAPEGLGVYIRRCSNVTADEKDAIVRNACNGVLNPTRTFVVYFANHLEGIDVDEINFIPTSAGTVNSIQHGQVSTPILKSKNGVLAKINVPGRVELDMMYGGKNDVDGILRFEPNVSLEIMKLALALNYTPAEVEAAARTYKAIIEQTSLFGKDF